MSEHIIQISGVGNSNDFYALTNHAVVWRYHPLADETKPGVWSKLTLPPGFIEQPERTLEVVDDSGRIPKGYVLFKNNDNGLFFWERAGDTAGKGLDAKAAEPFQGRFFERMEGAIADSRTDYMLRHPPAPPLAKLTK